MDLDRAAIQYYERTGGVQGWVRAGQQCNITVKQSSMTSQPTAPWQVRESCQVAPPLPSHTTTGKPRRTGVAQALARCAC